MLKNISLKGSMLLVLSLLMSCHALALGKTSATELQAICQDFNSTHTSPEIEQHKALCITFLKGFFAGENVHRAEQKPTPSFQEKALQSRAGGKLNETRSDFCIPKHLTLDDIGALISHEEMVSDLAAETLIERVLIKYFQCPK